MKFSWVGNLPGDINIKKDNFHYRSRFKTWGYQIIINTWRDRQRKDLNEKQAEVIPINGPVDKEGEIFIMDIPSEEIEPDIEAQDSLKNLLKDDFI